MGRVIRPHGVRGEVAVDVRTDDPAERFANGSVLETDPPSAGPLTVAGTRWHTGRLLVSFTGVSDRTQAEMLRGVWLVVDAAEIPGERNEDGVYHDSQLAGLTVVTVAGELVGSVTGVLHHGQDLLVVEAAAGTPRRGEILVPFVARIAVEVDLAANRLVIDPPAGLLDLASP